MVSRGAFDVDYQLQMMQNLPPQAGVAVGDVELASRWLKQSYTGLQQLQQDLGNRGRIIANAENRNDLADSFASAARPQTYTSHQAHMEVLGDLALIPGLTGAVASAVRAVLDLKDGHFLAAVQDGLGAIPGERLFGSGARLADEAERGLDDAGRGLSETERGLGDALSATSADHKQQAWDDYLARGGTWDYERWSTVYDLNQTRAIQANEAVNQRQQELGWGRTEVTVEAGGQTRRIDIADAIERRGEEVKTGYQTATQDNLSEIARDKSLIDAGWEIDWYFTGTASKPLLEHLREAGIPTNQEH